MITLKKLKIATSLSEETLAYTADVYWNGRLFGHISNRGNGGMSSLHRAEKGLQSDYNEALAFAKTQKVDLGDYAQTPSDHFYLHLEDYVDDLVGKEADIKAARQWITRNTKDKTVIVHDGKVLVFKAPWRGNTDKIATAIGEKFPGSVILNGLPIEEAIQKYLATA